MRRLVRFVLSLFVSAMVAFPAWSQSIQTDGDIETDAQLVSNVATGTAPLAVSSTTLVTSFNADQVDGMEASAFALDTDLQNVEALLLALGLAQVPRTGQTTCYSAAGSVIDCLADIGPGQDGALVMGVQWPNPRFTKNGDGTVTDNLTGLIWLEDANCIGSQIWANALAAANTLEDSGTPLTSDDCGLSDGSAQGAWRVPNLRELQSLVHYGVIFPAVPDTAGTGNWDEGDPFSGVQTLAYWSSTSHAGSADGAWVVVMGQGNISADGKGNGAAVWPVRGGQ